jgi:hypothetical protein
MAFLAMEAQAWIKMLSMRAKFSPGCVTLARVKTREQAVERAVSTLQAILYECSALGFDLQDIDPGHGPGHLARDYMNALRLFSELDARPQDIFIGLLGGVLHDFGLCVIPRYEESQRAIRHGEAAALLVDALIENAEHRFGLSKEEQIAVTYVIAAHTHYLKPMEVECTDGVMRKIEPYPDMNGDEPIWAVWFTRWVDRLDCNGPCFLGRHYLTLIDDHEDYGSDGFYAVKYGPHMQPTVGGDGPRTMLAHMRMFLGSQTNESPYGKYDFGRMVELREEHSARLSVILEYCDPAIPADSPALVAAVLQTWTRFLCTNIEPTMKGAAVAQALQEQFAALNPEAQWAWSRAFSMCMRQYCLWTAGMETFMDTVPAAWRVLPGVSEDVVAGVLRPNALVAKDFGPQ